MTDNKLCNLPVGECFELYGKKYKVVETVIEKDSEGKVTAKPDCCDCVFCGDKELACYLLKGKIPECISSCRKDGKLVIFQEVTKNEK